MRTEPFRKHGGDQLLILAWFMLTFWNHENRPDERTGVDTALDLMAREFGTLEIWNALDVVVGHDCERAGDIDLELSEPKLETARALALCRPQQALDLSASQTHEE